MNLGEQNNNFIAGKPSRVRMQSPKIEDATSPPSITNQLPINNMNKTAVGGF